VHEDIIAAIVGLREPIGRGTTYRGAMNVRTRRASLATGFLVLLLALLAGCTGPGNSAGSSAAPSAPASSAPASVAPSSPGGYDY
jgi:hypothetical protein